MMMVKLFLTAMILYVGTQAIEDTQICKCGTENNHVLIAVPREQKDESQRDCEDPKIDGSKIEKEIKSVNEKITKVETKIQESVDGISDKITRLEEKMALLIDEVRLKKCGVVNSIPDSKMTVSSVYGGNYPNWGPQHSRLFSTSGWGPGWLANYPLVGSWIEIDMGTNMMVRGVATQGRHSHYDHWVTTFTISFKTATSSNFQNVEDQSGAKKIFQGNTDRHTVVVNDVNIEARSTRIYPLTWNSYPVLRFDILTC